MEYSMLRHPSRTPSAHFGRAQHGQGRPLGGGGGERRRLDWPVGNKTVLVVHVQFSFLAYTFSH